MLIYTLWIVACAASVSPSDCTRETAKAASPVRSGNRQEICSLSDRAQLERAFVLDPEHGYVKTYCEVKKSP